MGCMSNRHHALILGNNLDGTTVDGELNMIHSLKGLDMNAACVRKGKQHSAVKSKLGTMYYASSFRKPMYPVMKHGDFHLPSL